jgi:hypothetical protein
MTVVTVPLNVQVVPTPRPPVARVGDDFDLQRDFWTAPIFTQEQVVLLAALSALFVFIGLVLIADLTVKTIYALSYLKKRLLARLRRVEPATRRERIRGKINPLDSQV